MIIDVKVLVLYGPIFFMVQFFLFHTKC